MDNDSVKTYTDNASFDKIFNDIFAKFQSFLKTKESAVLVKFISYSQGKAVFEIEDDDKVAGNCLIFSRDNSNNSIYAFLKIIEKKGSSEFIFSPIKIQVAFTPRKEERKILDFQKNLNQQLFIINMISEYIIKNSLELYKKQSVRIEDTIKVKLEKLFPKIRIYFINQGKDSRMNFFKKNIRPILISDINNKPADKNKEIYDFYMENIYSNDMHLKNDNQIVSEISIPIIYNMKIPYGYIQVNNYAPFSESSVQIVKKMALITNELLTKHGIFPKAEEKLTVFDISKSGIGVLFKNKQCVKYFNEGQFVYFDLLLPDNKKVNMLTSVRHISIKGSIYKVGCQIIELDALSEVYYEEYLESIGITG